MVVLLSHPCHLRQYVLQGRARELLLGDHEHALETGVQHLEEAIDGRKHGLQHVALGAAAEILVLESLVGLVDLLPRVS